MSVIWLESFITTHDEPNLFSFQSFNLLIYLNMFSCCCFLLYSLLYNNDRYMQKPPSKNFKFKIKNLDTLIILKMFAECLLSLHLLILFLCFSFENHKRKIGETSIILYYQSLFSPVALFLNYFLNGCLAHNLYATFFSFNSTFEKRITKYKLFSLIGCLIIFLISLECNTNTHDTTLVYSFTYYTNSFYKVYYFSGLCLIAYIFYVIYMILKKDDFFSHINTSFNSKKTEKKKDLMKLFVRRHIFLLISFIISFLPNNLIIVIQTFTEFKICGDCSNYGITLYFLSLSCTLTFFMKMSEPYMMKYFHGVLNFVLRKKTEVKE